MVLTFRARYLGHATLVRLQTSPLDFQSCTGTALPAVRATWKTRNGDQADLYLHSWVLMVGSHDTSRFRNVKLESEPGSPATVPARNQLHSETIQADSKMLAPELQASNDSLKNLIRAHFSASAISLSGLGLGLGASWSLFADTLD
ncbi:hypothetical protein DFH09DRAFT_1096205 [Mycena vulgaris]|nr:hypothetical protein DFH09DRAFT_1096205 [Mycena vulgaris]